MRAGLDTHTITRLILICLITKNCLMKSITLVLSTFINDVIDFVNCFHCLRKYLMI